MKNRYKQTVFARCREMQNSRSALRRRLGFYWERKFQENFARAFIMNVVLVIVIQITARFVASKIAKAIIERMERHGAAKRKGYTPVAGPDPLDAMRLLSNRTVVTEDDPETLHKALREMHETYGDTPFEKQVRQAAEDREALQQLEDRLIEPF